MGTTLTGTTPQDTYDSLIKVTDNGPLSGTAKYLSDGLGNDSALALSTAFVGSGTTAISNWQLFKGFQTIGGNAFVGYEDQSEIWSNSFYDGAFKYFANGFATRFACINGDYDFSTAPENTSGAGAAATFTNRLKITNGGNVGIGTNTPATRLHVAGADAWLTLQRTSGTTNIIDFTDSAAARIGYVGAIASNITINAAAGNSIIFAPNNAEAGRFTANGLCFNGDTLAANALDDYEEGTFTPTVAFGGASVGITYLTQAAKYTKVGNKVSFSIVVTLSNKGSSTGSVSIAGLPFNVSPSTNADFIPITIGAFINITFSTVPACVAIVNTNTLILDEFISGGAQTPITNADFANDSTFRLAGFYFV